MENRRQKVKMRITRLRVKNWRNFRDAEVRLERRSFFVGANATGKSNLLDAIKFLRDLVIDGGGLPFAVKERRGVGQIRSVFARNKPNVCLEIDLGDDDQLVRWTYELEFKADNKTKAPLVVHERVTDGLTSKRIINRPDKNDAADPARLTQTALEQVNANKAFREIADFCASITYLHAVPQIIRDPRRAVGTHDPYGGDLIARIARTPKPTRTARLRRMQEALAVAVPQLDELTLTTDERGVPHLQAKYRHWRPNDRQAMVRINRSGATEIGPEYNSRLSQFAARVWRPTKAATRSDSLSRALRRIEDLKLKLAQEAH